MDIPMYSFTGTVGRRGAEREREPREHRSRSRQRRHQRPRLRGGSAEATLKTQ